MLIKQQTMFQNVTEGLLQHKPSKKPNISTM